MISGIAGNTSSSWKSYCRWTRGSATLSASRANGPVPPEDCGGVWGYASFLEALHDPEHPEHEEMLEWIGGEFDPEAFDLNEVNVELQRLTQSEVRGRPR
jgi:hypothetical protein